MDVVSADHLHLVALAASVPSLLYIMFAIDRVAAFRMRLQDTAPNGHLPAVTVFKPICGMDPELGINLRSFCDQDYPTYQVLFGVRDWQDPAIQVIEELIAEFPERDFKLVVDDRNVGNNYKVGNLTNMYRWAKHDIIVVSDSDIRVGRSYLRTIAGPFQDLEVGAVTCLYTGSSVGGVTSVLGAMYVNDWFLPSALISLAGQDLRFGFGATIAVRRKALEAMGGFRALARYLADDYMLGMLVSKNGYKVRLAPYLVETVIREQSLKSLFLKELRWARTIRSIQPLGFAFSFVTDVVPISMLAAAILYLSTGQGLWATLLVVLMLLLRIHLHYGVRRTGRIPHAASPWLIPLRDFLTFAVRLISFTGRTVHWRQRQFLVRAGGELEIMQERDRDDRDEVVVPKSPLVRRLRRRGRGAVPM